MSTDQQALEAVLSCRQAIDRIEAMITRSESEGYVDALWVGRRQRELDRYERSRAAAMLYPTAAAARNAAPIDMVLHCPACKFQHIDKADVVDPSSTPEKDAAHWSNPPHRTHFCNACGFLWRPANVATNGVQALAGAVWPSTFSK